MRAGAAVLICAASLGLVMSCGGGPSSPAQVPTPTPIPDLTGLYRFDFYEQGILGCPNDHIGHQGWTVSLVQTGTSFVLQVPESPFTNLQAVGRLAGDSVAIEFTIHQRLDPPHVNDWRGTGTGTLQNGNMIGRWQGTITCPAPSHAQFSCEERNRQFRLQRSISQ